MKQWRIGNRGYKEVSTRKCMHITKHVHWIVSAVWVPPTFDGLREVEEFIDEFEEQVPTELRTRALDIALKTTPTIWWATHKESLGPWRKVIPMLKVRFIQDPGYVEN